MWFNYGRIVAFLEPYKARFCKDLIVNEAPKKSIISVDEYRRLLGDYKSTDEQIVERLQFLEAFCRNIIKPEIKKYANTRQGTH